MKWEKPNHPTQHSADKKYCIVQATTGNWVAYRMGTTTGEQIGLAQPTDIQARQLCEAHEKGDWI